MIHFQSISLEAMLSRTPHIVEVIKDTPANSMEEMPIHENKEKYPPFIVHRDHFKVLEVIYGGTIKKGDKITVLESHFDNKKHLHTRYYLESLSKSPLYDVYEGSAMKESDERSILFIRQNEGGEYEYVMGNAIESITRKQEIIRLLNKKK